jgi:hypothetical protein
MRARNATDLPNAWHAMKRIDLVNSDSAFETIAVPI